MEKEILETVLIELLEETKKINVLIEKQNKEIRELKSSVTPKLKFWPALDTLPLSRILTEGINRTQK